MKCVFAKFLQQFEVDEVPASLRLQSFDVGDLGLYERTPEACTFWVRYSVQPACDPDESEWTRGTGRVDERGWIVNLADYVHVSSKNGRWQVEHLWPASFDPEGGFL